MSARLAPRPERVAEPMSAQAFPAHLFDEES